MGEVGQQEWIQWPLLPLGLRSDCEQAIEDDWGLTAKERVRQQLLLKFRGELLANLFGRGNVA